jgi:hypothetical protein
LVLFWQSIAADCGRKVCEEEEESVVGRLLVFHVVFLLSFSFDNDTGGDEEGVVECCSRRY